MRCQRPGHAKSPAVAVDDFASEVSRSPLAPFVRLGDAGRTVTPLRPAGKAVINGRRVDVITRGQMLDEDRPVEVIEVSGNHVVVHEIVKA